jgi:hypothetical protein
MGLRRFWILLFVFSVTNCFAETFHGLIKPINSTYSHESMVTFPFKVSNLQYSLQNPFNSTNLVSDIVFNIHFDQNNNYKKIQDLGSSHHHLSQSRKLFPTFQKGGYHLCMINRNDAFYCKFQI